jgi:GNAT superfamily N-acetyltransferase
MDQCVGYYPTEVLELWTSGGLPKEFVEMIEKDFYIATEEGRPVGTGMVDAGTGKIDAIFVDPSHMGKGIGKAMVQFLEKVALNCGLQMLSLESTLNAAPFYRACGFQGNQVSTYLSPSGVSLKCVLMYKRISPNKAQD